MSFKTAIIGGGASGLMAAITAAERHQVVTIYEQMEKPGKKIYATGNGKCNFTNKNRSYSNYSCGTESFIIPALSEFSADMLFSFFQRLGILYKEKRDCYYPYSEQASTVVNAFLQECKRLSVVFVYARVTAITKENGKFYVHTESNTERYDNVILACGGKSQPKLGSDGSGYVLAKALGHTLTSLYAGLVPVKCKEPFYPSVSGVRQEAVASLYSDKQEITAKAGEVLFTAYGLSGIVIMQLSSYIGKLIDQGSKVEICLDFFPQYQESILLSHLVNRIHHSPKITCEELLNGMLSEKLNLLILKTNQIHTKTAATQLSDNMLHSIVKKMKCFSCRVDALCGFDQSQVTVGGICTDELNPNTMESKIVPGLYFCGEILDVDGTCGGYNLQWAFSSGYLAGKCCSDSSVSKGSVKGDEQK